MPIAKWKIDGEGNPFIDIYKGDGVTELGKLEGVVSASIDVLGDENTATSIVADVGDIQALIDGGIDLSKKII